MDLRAGSPRLPRALGAALLVLGLAACGGTGDEEATPSASATEGAAPSAGDPAEVPSARELVPVLDSPQEDVDRSLPDPALEGSQPAIDHESLRFLGEIDGARHYVALDASGDICLFVSLTGEGDVVGSTCTTPADLDDGGLGLRVSARGASAEAYLVPSGLDESSLAEAAQAMQGAAPVHENLLVVTDEGDLGSARTLEIARADGGTFTLHRL